jgi:hypothetical protein
LAGNLVKPLLSLYGTEWRERGYGLSILEQSRKATVYHSVREVTSRDVVFRDIKNTPVTQMRGVHIRDKTIKDCILLGL